MKRIHNTEKIGFSYEIIYIAFLLIIIILLMAMIALPLILIFGIISATNLLGIIGVACCGIVLIAVIFIIIISVFLYVEPGIIWTFMEAAVELAASVREIMITPHVFIVTKKTMKVKKIFQSRRFGLNSHDFYYYRYGGRLVIKNGSTMTYRNVKEETVQELIKNGVVIIFKDEDRYKDSIGYRIFEFLRRQLKSRKMRK